METGGNDVFHVLAVRRHRMGIDGSGINTLAALSGCPASCRYCLNAEVLSRGKWKDMTPEQLLEEVSVDMCYMLPTGGGVTFGGGEPLLQSRAIEAFAAIRPAWMKLNLETSLQADEEAVERLIPHTDLWIIDLKAPDEETYKRYTGLSKRAAERSLELLQKNVPERCRLRIPAIPGYVTEEAADNYAERLAERGFKNIERFSYVVR